MKGTGKILLVFILATGSLLLYVHEQVEMLRVSYRIHSKSSSLSKRTEEYRRLKYDVTRLRSPEVLEKRLQELDLGLTLPKEIKTLRVQPPVFQPELSQAPVSATPVDQFFNFLGQWVQVAQARTDG